MRIFFDASVIISGILSAGGGSAQLLAYSKLGIIHGITSQTVVAEVISKTSKLKKTAAELESFIAQSGLIVRKSLTSEDIKPYIGKIDLGDAHLIAGAFKTRSTLLVTLDKRHVLRSEVQETFLPLRIVTPRQLLEELVSSVSR
ncbi:MAG: PIN domain-containing protein [Patescibacteria group bacterium]